MVLFPWTVSARGPKVCGVLIVFVSLIQCGTQECAHCQRLPSSPVTAAIRPGLSGTIPIFVLKVPCPRKLLVLGKMEHLVTCPDHGSVASNAASTAPCALMSNTIKPLPPPTLHLC